jgi:acetyl/propionyl-CoA carboxylase alpha subunit
LPSDTWRHRHRQRMQRRRIAPRESSLYIRAGSPWPNVCKPMPPSKPLRKRISSPKVSGYLSDVRVDIGDHVKAGQVLAVIDVPEMVQQLAEAKAQLETKQRALETARWQVEHSKADLALQEVTFNARER